MKLLIPADLVINLLRHKRNDSQKNLTYLLRHQLYNKKSTRIKKESAAKVLDAIENNELKTKLKRLIQSDLYVLKVTNVELEDYNDYVYDVSVPQSQMFFGGTNPILLHNSDERGIDVVRVKVKDFARTRSLSEVPFKIIFLDECDALTKDAQHALRRTMENYTSTCRFLLSANYSSKIIDPIQSRCTLFKFKPLPKESVLAIIATIAQNEQLIIERDAQEALFAASGGDCRKMENILQSCAALDKHITAENVYQIASAADPKELRAVLQKAVEGKFLEARKELLKVMLSYGLSGLDMIKQIQHLIWELPVDDRRKMSLIEACGEIEFRMVEGSDEFIQLEALLARFGSSEFGK